MAAQISIFIAVISLVYIAYVLGKKDGLNNYFKSEEYMLDVTEEIYNDAVMKDKQASVILNDALLKQAEVNYTLAKAYKLHEKLQEEINASHKNKQDIDINFQGRKLIVFTGNHDGKDWVQVGMNRPCVDTGEMNIGKGGKAYISKHATPDEIIKKILGLAIAYVEHEIREGFTYQGKRLFEPHISIEALMSISNQTVGRLHQPLKNGN